jgi:hypothetical protein
MMSLTTQDCVTAAERHAATSTEATGAPAGTPAAAAPPLPSAAAELSGRHDRGLQEAPEPVGVTGTALRRAGSMDPILRFFNLQLQSQRCSRLQRFPKYNKIFLFSKSARLPVAL